MAISTVPSLRTPVIMRISGGPGNSLRLVDRLDRINGIREQLDKHLVEGTGVARHQRQSPRDDAIAVELGFAVWVIVVERLNRIEKKHVKLITKFADLSH